MESKSGQHHESVTYGRSVGPLRGTINCRFKISLRCLHFWDAVNDAQDDFKDKVQPDIRQYLEHNLPESESWVGFVLYMVGKTEERAKPIVTFVSCDKKVRNQAFNIIKLSGIMERYPEFGLANIPEINEFEGFGRMAGCDDVDVLAAIPHQRASSATVFTAKSGNPNARRLLVFQGTELTSRANIATGGGVVSYSGKRMILTVNHLLDEQVSKTQYDTDDAGEDFEDGCEITGLSDDDEDEEDFIDATGRGSITPESSTSEVDASDSIFSSEYTIEAEISFAQIDSRLGTLAADETFLTGDDGHIVTESSNAMDDLVVAGQIVVSSPPFDILLIETDPETWVRESLDSQSLTDNVIPLEGSSEHIERGPRDAAVKTVTPDGGAIGGTISGTPSFFRLPGTKRFREVYLVIFNRPLAKGDCGSWVKDAITGRLFGHVIAGSPKTGLTMVMPAHEVFRHAYSVLSSKASAVLEDLSTGASGDGTTLGAAEDTRGSFANNTSKGKTAGIPSTQDQGLLAVDKGRSTSSGESPCNDVSVNTYIADSGKLSLGPYRDQNTANDVQGLSLENRLVSCCLHYHSGLKLPSYNCTRQLNDMAATLPNDYVSRHAFAHGATKATASSLGRSLSNLQKALAEVDELFVGFLRPATVQEALGCLEEQHPSDNSPTCISSAEVVSGREFDLVDLAQTVARSTKEGSPTFERAVCGKQYGRQGDLMPRTKYERPKHPKVKCSRCNDYEDGFRGEHELRRHTEARHKGVAYSKTHSRSYKSQQYGWHTVKELERRSTFEDYLIFGNVDPNRTWQRTEKAPKATHRFGQVLPRQFKALQLGFDALGDKLPSWVPNWTDSIRQRGEHHVRDWEVAKCGPDRNGIDPGSCIRRLPFRMYEPGDALYSLLGLLPPWGPRSLAGMRLAHRLNADLDHQDLPFQAFIRLWLANDSDTLLGGLFSPLLSPSEGPLPESLNRCLSVGGSALADAVPGPKQRLWCSPIKPRRDNDGSRTYCAPELPRFYSEEEGNTLELPLTSDAWSLGCVLSGCLAWMAGGEEGRREYEERRKEDTRDVAGIHGSGYEACFHNRTDRLPCVNAVHSTAMERPKKFDTFSPIIPEIVKRTMLLACEEGHLDAMTVWHQFHIG